MKLLTHNMLQCHIKGVQNGYPFKIEAEKVEVRGLAGGRGGSEWWDGTRRSSGQPHARLAASVGQPPRVPTRTTPRLHAALLTCPPRLRQVRE